MAIDWDAFEDGLDQDIDDAADRTDAKLASRISSVTRFTDDEIKALFPDPADTKKLAKLMKIVQSADNRNRKINKIVANAEEFGGIVLTLLSKFC